jgi:ATP-dependent exoDNAse (exonuclease V) beta subunit
MADGDPTDVEARTQISTALGQTLFVEAGAGTGKTSELVNRIVALIDDGVTMREIAAITFTEAAAAELRDRVRAALDAQLDVTDDPTAISRYTNALDELDAAAVSTLHAFAQRVLSEHPIEVGLPPSVDVHDEVTSQLEFESRWEMFVDRIYDDPALEPTMLRKMAADVRDDALKAVARDFNENWDRLREHPTVAVEPAPVDVSAILDELAAIESECALADADDQLVRFVFEVVRPFVDDLDALGELERIKGLQYSFPKPGNKGAKGKWPDGHDIAGLKDRIRALDDLRAEALGRVQDQVLRRLAVDLTAFTLEAADERRRRGLLEFHDLLVLARDLLRGSASARATLHDRYTQLLHDEYQDTDPIQIELALLKAARDRAPSPDDAWSGIDNTTASQ